MYWHNCSPTWLTGPDFPEICGPWLSADCCSSALEEIQFGQAHDVLEDVVVTCAVWSRANDRPNLRSCDFLRTLDSLPPSILAWSFLDIGRGAKISSALKNYLLSEPKTIFFNLVEFFSCLLASFPCQCGVASRLVACVKHWCCGGKHLAFAHLRAATTFATAKKKIHNNLWKKLQRRPWSKKQRGFLAT